MISILFSRLCILACGILYPGYISFKTVRAKNIADYVKWMMYWVAFAVFKATEAIADIFFSWFPFYYEFKVLFILWLLPTTANGSSFIYKKFIHPLLKQHEARVDYHFCEIKTKWRDLVLQHLKEAVLCVGRNIMVVINKNFPQGVLSLLSNNNLNNRSVQITPIIDEKEVKKISKKVANQRRASAKTKINKELEVVQNVQSRPRNTRQNKHQIENNLNES